MYTLIRRLGVFPLMLFLTAGYAQTLSVQALEPLLSTPLEMSDVTAQSATLRITTLIDLACVVVFGTDESFGHLALDQDMGAGAHRDHNVLLRGLEPDTEYLYRLQGSDANGNLYASEVQRFRTPPAEASLDLGVNVATLERGARVLSVSSVFSAGFAAENALDGNPSSEWSSSGDGDNATLTLELPGRVTFSGFGLWSRTMGSSAEISRFEVETEDGTVYGPFSLEDAASLHRFPARGQGQRFTFRILSSSGGNTGLVEVAVYVEE